MSDQRQAIDRLEQWLKPARKHSSAHLSGQYTKTPPLDIINVHADDVLSVYLSKHHSENQWKDDLRQHLDDTCSFKKSEWERLQQE